MPTASTSNNTVNNNLPNNQALDDAQTMQLVLQTLVGDPKLTDAIQINTQHTDKDYIGFSLTNSDVIKKLTANIQTPEQIRNLFALQLPGQAPAQLEKPPLYPKAMLASQINGKDLLEQIFGTDTVSQYGFLKANLTKWRNTNNQLESNPQASAAKEFRLEQIKLFKKILSQSSFADLRNTISVTPFNQPLIALNEAKPTGPLASIVDKMLGIKEQPDGTFTIFFDYGLYFSCLQAPAIEAQSDVDFRIKRADFIAFLGAAFDDRMTAYYTDPANKMGRILAFGEPVSELIETEFMLILDFSYSMQPYVQTYRQKIIELINKLTSEYDPTTKIRIVPFADEAFEIAEFKLSQLVDIKNYVNNLTTRGLTALLNTINNELGKINTNSTSNICVIIFTDGMETMLNNSERPLVATFIHNKLNNFGTWQPKIFSLGYGQVDRDFLINLSTQTGCNFISINEVADFSSTILQQSEELKIPRKLLQFIQEAKSFKLFVKAAHAVATPVLNLSAPITVNNKTFNPTLEFKTTNPHRFAWMSGSNQSATEKKVTKDHRRTLSA